MSASPTPKRPFAPAPRQPRRGPRFLVLLVLLILLLCTCAFAVSAVVVASVTSSPGLLFVPSTTQPARPGPNSTAVAAAFMEALKAGDYARATSSLDPDLLAELTSADVAQAARQADACYGEITGFWLSASSQQGQQARDTFAVTRDHFSYPFSLTLQNQQGVWLVEQFGTVDTFDPSGSVPCHVTSTEVPEKK